MVQAVNTYKPELYGELVSRRAGASTWHLFDALGSTLRTANAAQAVSGSNRYTGYGESIVGAVGSPFLWVGRSGYYNDADLGLGLYYVRARWYDTALGRWLSRDPIGFVGSQWVLYEYALSNPVNGADPSGLWLAIGDDKWLSDSDRDTFEQLVRIVAPVIKNPTKNKSCIRPIPYGNAGNPDRVDEDCERAWKRMRPAMCCIYDVKNLVDALPIGGPTLASVGYDNQTNAYISLAGAFYSVQQQHLTGPQLAQLMKQQSQEGSTPLKSVTVIGHSWARQFSIGSIDGLVVFQLRNLLDLGYSSYSQWPKWSDAIQGKRPPLCWLRTDASVRLVGCRTIGFAGHWAQAMIRGTAAAFGTTRPTWAFQENGGVLMGWGKPTKNWRAWEPDPQAGKASTPDEYHKMRYWLRRRATN